MHPSFVFQKRFSAGITVENLRLDMLLEPHRTVWKPLDNQLTHIHSCCELIFCCSGQVTVHRTGSPIVLGEGDIAVIPPQVKHVCTCGEQTEWGAASFSCIPQQSGGKKDLWRLFRPFFEEKDILVLRGVPQIRRSAAALNDALLCGASWTASALFFGLLVSAAEQYAHSPAPSDNMDGGGIDQINRLDSIINTCYTQELSADTIAAQMFLSRRQLSRIVKKNYGTSLNRLLTEKRLSVAEHLLLTTDDAVAQISAAAGFGSPASFYRKFTEKHHISPMEFRSRQGTGKPE